MRGSWLVDARGDLVGDADAVAFEGNDFFRVIGEHANVFEAEIDQDLRADAAFVLDHALAGRFAIELTSLVAVNLREHARPRGRTEGGPASMRVEVQQDAAGGL